MRTAQQSDFSDTIPLISVILGYVSIIVSSLKAQSERLVIKLSVFRCNMSNSKVRKCGVLRGFNLDLPFTYSLHETESYNQSMKAL